MTETARSPDFLEERARQLAMELPAHRRPGRPRRFAKRVTALRAQLRSAAEQLMRSSDPTTGIAAEWLLDNEYLVLRAVDQVGHDVPAGFFARLPKAHLEGAGLTRAEVLARESLAASDDFVDVPGIQRFVRVFQSVTALDIGELWAFPAFLRLVVAEQVVKAAHDALPPVAESDVNARIAAAVGSLRAIESADWKDFFESLSVVDRYLRLDPHKSYVRLDFETRDRYRGAVEELARWSRFSEANVARAGLASARETGQPLGAFLIGRERRAFEHHLGCRAPLGRRLVRFFRRYGGAWYFGGITVSTLGILFLLLLPVVSTYATIGPAWTALALLLALVPASSLAIAVCNEVATRVTRPRRLPKLDLSSEVPDEFRTLAAVPALLSDAGEIQGLLRQMELNYRGNSFANLPFALLADPVDAEQRERPEDDALLELAAAGIRQLNERCGSDPEDRPFVLLTRDRTWNPAENCWMAWERKRGKLHELNQLLLGREGSGLRLIEGDAAALADVRYVLVLDADTFLPEGAAARLIGTLAHPLHVARFGDGRVAQGYTVLQPRVETLADSTHPTWFSKIFQASDGFDLYSHAASDVYQDIFAEGIFAGKGLYDVHAFERSVADRVPENALLSHDLFEGVHGRAALVSDVTVIESYPSHPVAYMHRLHRWVRGDWQIARWLLPIVPGSGSRRLRNDLSLLDRWKIFDNLRRSVLSISLLVLTVVGWWWLPGDAWWTLLPLVVLGVPTLLPALIGALARWRSPTRESAFRTSADRTAWAGARWITEVTLLPWQAWVEVDAIVRTLHRLLVSRRHFLQWTSAAATARSVSGGASVGRLVLDSIPMWLTPLAIGVGGVLLGTATWPTQGPLLLVWLSVPLVAWGLSRRIPGPNRHVDPDETRRLRRLARRTWAYFERLMTGEDHWLPPDNLQEHPVAAVARRTSPTNIGLGMLAQLVGSDLGYVSPSRLTASLQSTLDTLDRLERHRGHLLNWYDTRYLRPLSPRYVSSVDSGNLAASAITIGEGLRGLPDTTLPSLAHADGLVDGLEVLAETLEEFRTVAEFRAERLPATVRRLAAEIQEARHDGRLFAERLNALVQVGLPTIEAEVAEALESSGRSTRGRSLGIVRDWVRGLDGQALALHEEIQLLVPWLGALREAVPVITEADDPELVQAWLDLVEDAPESPTLAMLPAVHERLEARLRVLDQAVAAAGTADEVAEARRWIAHLTERLHAASDAARGLLEDVEALRSRLAALVEGMDFGFLYDQEQKLLRVGYHVDAATLDRSHYDLYASEARLASFIAIAKGDVPAEHWRQLGRPFSRRDGTIVLLSWAGTMFEYLMPGLFLRTPPGSLAGVACHRAVELQIRHGRRHRIPWGVSESGFHQTDPQNFYRYRAFGVGALAVRSDPGDRVVAAPYASLLALGYDPERTVRNLGTLERLGMSGALGLYEAADFGPRGGFTKPQIVRSFMAHHQGMILASVDNFLNGSVLIERFHRDSQVATFEYLLHEAAPGRVRVEPAPSRPRLLAPPRRPVPPRVPTWAVDPDSFPTPVTVLSNGALSSLVTATGTGGLRWRGRDVLRWRPDPTAQTWGSWIYVRDVESGRRWSAGLAPTWAEPERYRALFGPHAVELQREDSGISMRTVVTTATTADIEIRRVTLVNESGRARTVELTSYAEVALAYPAEDRRHPAFSKLFVEGRYASRARALLLERRVRGEEGPLCIAHAVVGPDPEAEPVFWELDRGAFLGRRGSPRSPDALGREPAGKAADHPWAPLDPIVSLTTRVEVPAASEVSVSFLTAVADAPGSALAILDAYRSPGRALFAESQARDRVRSLLQELSLDPDLLPVYQRLLTAIAFPYHALRPQHSGPASAYQETLWTAGISGDLPVVVLETGAGEEGLLEELVRAQTYWERQGVRFDLAVVGQAADGYAQPLRIRLDRMLTSLGAADRMDRPGGVHHVSFGRMAGQALASMRAAASLALVDDGRALEDHLAGIAPAEPRIPPFVPTPRPEAADREIDPVTRPPDLAFDNGVGGFSSEDGAYHIYVDPGRPTPAPWSNVVADEGFGFLVTESGGGFTWIENSGELRLTPWRNDPVADVPSEVLYLRDEETGSVWSATPSPAPAPAPYRVVHRPGSTSFHHRSHGLDQRLELLTPPDAPVKIVDLTVTNEQPHPRRLTATYFSEWVLGSDAWAAGPHLSSEALRADNAIVVRNRFAPPSAGLVGFLGASRPIHQFTCDRHEFLGPEGDYSRPAGLVRIGLEGRTGSGLDPCAALQVHLDLAAGEARTVRFLLGAAHGEENALSVLRRFRDPTATPDVRRSVDRSWENLLARITVHTPEPAMDLMLNGWLLYQALSCRLWGRSGYYQSSGAFGFRDQLQDSLALMGVAPHLTRQRILDAALHQFTEGDVLHWWHPETDRGVRTRCSDDLLWLPYAVVEYLDAVGDRAILDESVAFLGADPLGPEEVERYDSFPRRSAAPLYEHCMSALRRAGARSERGLPLIGSGDWNDALNRVGLEGRGESVWLAWFLYHVETRFADVAEHRGDQVGADHLRADAEQLRSAVETHAWDGAWYLRATFDDGTPIGSAQSPEARIDSLTQSWAVISGGADEERARTAMRSVSQHLIREDDRLVLLLTPPFHAMAADPGYIRSYPPGVRENGGQYTHAAAWVGYAFAAMGDGDRAEEVFRLLNPILHATDPDGAALYRVEPYVTAGDVYGAPPHTGRGGWTWYTGSAGWLYRLGIEAVLGLRPAHGGLRIQPCIPRGWERYGAHVRVGTDTLYRIDVRNPHGVCTGQVTIRMDGRPLPGSVIPLDDDGAEHDVDVVLGGGEPDSASEGAEYEDGTGQVAAPSDQEG